MTDTVNVGTGYGTKDGDKARDGGGKINAHFALLDAEVAMADANIASLQAAVAGLGGGSSNVFLSISPGIDPTGFSDSHAGIVAAFAAVAGTNKTLVIDCPVYIAQGTDNTRTIFVSGGTNLSFTAQGAFILDAHGAPQFAWIGAAASNCTWTNYTVRYIGNPGSVMLVGSGTWYTNNGNWNTVTLTNYLAATNGNTFSSATAIWPGPTNTSALHYFGGAVSNVNFVGSCSATAQFPTADRFILCLCSINTQWAQGQAVVGGGSPTPVNATTAAQPRNLSFDGFTVDGCYMGWVGGGNNVKMRNIVSLRYGDLEDSSGNNKGGQSNVSGRSCNLSTESWMAPPHLFYLQSTNTAFPVSIDYANILDEGVYTSNDPTYGTRRSAGSGYINSMKFDASGLSTISGYISKRPDGFADILGQVGGGITAGSFMDNVDVIMDTGVGAYLVNATGPISGTSFTVTGANWQANNSGATYVGINTGTYFTQFSTGECRQVTYTVTVVGNSATTVAAAFSPALLSTATAVVRFNNAPTSFALRYPGTPAQDLSIDIKVLDLATVPLGYPIQSDASVGHINVKFNATVMVQDYPHLATYTPGFGIAGEGINCFCRTIFTNCTNNTTGKGPIVNTSAIPTFDNVTRHELHGWRQTAITFTTAPTGSGGSILAAMWPIGVTGWIYPNGTYNVIFSDGEVRAGVFTNGSAAVTWTPALTGTPTVSAQVSLINQAQYAGFRARIQLAQTNSLVNYGVSASVIDTSNGIELIVNQGMIEESWTQFWQGIPTGSTGITYDATWAIDRAAWGVTAALSGGSATAINLTTGGNTILTNGLITSPVPIPIVGAQPYAGVITVAPASGTLPNAGTAVVTVRGRRTSLST